MNIPLTNLQLLIEFASLQGMNREDISAQLPARINSLQAAGETVTVQEYTKVLSYILAENTNNQFGLRYGFYLNLQALGLVYRISLSATGIEQAVFMLKQYLEHNFPLIGIHAFVQKKNFLLQVYCTRPELTCGQALLDSTLVVLYRELLLMSGPRIKELRMPSGAAGYKKWFTCSVKKHRDHVLVLPGKLLGEPVNAGRKKEIEVLLPQFLKMTTNPGKFKPFSARVRNMVLNMCGPELPELKQVACQFLVSSRSLQRRLREEGQSYRKITDEIKKELSSYLQKDNTLTTQETAWLLGFSSSSAYLHAVKKWNA